AFWHQPDSPADVQRKPLAIFSTQSSPQCLLDLFWIRTRVEHCGNYRPSLHLPVVKAPFMSRTLAQNCSSESATHGSRSYSAQRRSHSKRWATGGGNASGWRTEPANSSASSSRSRSVNCPKFGISAARTHDILPHLRYSSMLAAGGLRSSETCQTSKPASATQ